jgi:hypothetical protein
VSTEVFSSVAIGRLLVLRREAAAAD